MTATVATPTVATPTVAAAEVAAPELPRARGPLSGRVLALLRGEPAGPLDVEGADPYGDDLQLALYCCYETHYRGFAGVDDELEWDPALLGARGACERLFLAALRADVEPGDDVGAEVDGLLVERVGPGSETGVSHHLLRRGELWQVREYLAHRSLYHLKEADPQAWVIPRLVGPPKAALVAVEYDEYGGGRPERMHARMFADMLAWFGLDHDYGAYLDAAPAATLAEVNLMSLFGLHRSLRGALVGQFAVVELTSSPGSDRLVRAMRRLGLDPAASAFYDEHVEADAVHEQLIRTGVLGPLLEAEPGLAADVVFGMRAALLLDTWSGQRVLECWNRGESSLRTPLPGPRAGSSAGRPG
jgi:hypothetical protein